VDGAASVAVVEPQASPSDGPSDGPAERPIIASADVASADVPSADVASDAAPPPPESPSPDPSTVATPYPPADDAVVGDPESFYLATATDALLAHARDVALREGPIVVETLSRRVASAWGIGRLTAKVRERASELIQALALEVDDDGVVWPPGASPETWEGFRVEGPDSATRDASELPPVEVANALLHVLRQNVALGVDDLLREGARCFGLTRLGRAVRERMQMGLDRLVARGDGAVDGDTVRLPR